MTACSPLLNLAYFTNLEARIAALGAIGINGSAADKAAALAKLQSLATELSNDLNTLYSTLESQITLNNLLAPLLNASAIVDLPSAITWIKDTITFLNQYALPIINLPTQIAALVAAVATLATAISNAATLLGGVVTLPALSVICVLEGA